MTYSAALDYLQTLRQFGQKLGLETMLELARRLGNPERSLRFIHIAGTNGKGSVAAMLRAMLTAAGYRTALYTSPHLVSVCERFQVDDRLIDENEAARLVTELQPLAAAVSEMPELRSPTYFEFMTAVALRYFAEQRAEVVVWETGLGGRLDATNIVTPLVSVITNIGFDHMQYLGNTLPEIAAEKAGIIKAGVPVVTAAVGEPLAVIRRQAMEEGSRVIVIGEAVRTQAVSATDARQQLRLIGTRADYGVLTVPLLGAHQLVNCATAVAALEASALAVETNAVQNGLATTAWPGRFQIIGRNPTVVLDGAHNPAGVETLVATLRAHFAGQNVRLVLGILRDKDFPAMCRLLAPLAGEIWCVRVNSERTAEPAEIAQLCRAANPQVRVSVAQDVAEAVRNARADQQGVVLIAGSLFLIGEVLQQLGATKDARELRLQ